MARIKVTGYIDTADYDDSALDLENSTGLTEDAYLELMEDQINSLEDVDVRLEK